MSELSMVLDLGVPWRLRRWRICLQYRKPRFGLWVGKIPWRRKQLPTPAFWPGEFHGQRSPVGLQSMESQRVRHDRVPNTFHFKVQSTAQENLFPRLQPAGLLWYLLSLHSHLIDISGPSASDDFNLWEGQLLCGSDPAFFFANRIFIFFFFGLGFVGNFRWNSH